MPHKEEKEVELKYFQIFNSQKFKFLLQEILL